MRTVTLSTGDPLPSPLADLIVTSARFPRRLLVPGSTPAEQTGYRVLAADAAHCEFHDLAEFGWWADGRGVKRDHLLYDVVVYNCGWTAPDRGHGPALYTQNYADGGQRTIDTCVFIAGFSIPGKIYGTNSEIRYPGTFLSPLNKLANYTLRRSIFVGDRFIIGNEGRSAWGAHNIDIEDCTFLSSRLTFGYEGQNGDGRVVGSLLTASVGIESSTPGAGYRDSASGKLVSWRNLAFTDNVVFIPKGQTFRAMLPSPGWQFDRNTYYSEEDAPFELVTEGPGAPPYYLPTFITRRLAFAEWRAATGFDAHSTFTTGLPDQRMRRSYLVPEKNAENVAIWLPDVPTGRVLFPPPDPEGWEGSAPEVVRVQQSIAVYREQEDEDMARIAELEAQLAAAIERIQAVETELADAKETVEELRHDLIGVKQDVAHRDNIIAALRLELAACQPAVRLGAALKEYLNA